MEALSHYETALSLRRELEPATRARIAEKLGDVALRLGRVDQATEVWQQCLDYHRRQEDLARVGDLHRKIGAGLWHKGDREGSIEHYQKGIDLLKDGPPCLELVRLYEEAASLYMHTGDNMLAIYASEKALRLAERLGEAAAASRAHGIFGRVFGRIGDSERARQNLERSVELARESDPAEAVRALLTLGYHLEVSEADYEGAGAAYTEALELAEQTGDLPSKVELHAALAQLAAHSGDWETVSTEAEASGSLAEREGLTGKLCFPYMMRGMLRWREGDFDESAKGLRRAAELAEQVGRSEVAFQSLYWLAASLRQRGDHADADTELARALDLCERAGLVAQSVEAISARAVNLALAGRKDAAREAADEAGRLADRLRYPVGKAASLEARGAVADDPAEASSALTEARDAWQALGRPLDAARCDYLRGRILAESDPAEAREALESAAAGADRYGVHHLAELARELHPGLKNPSHQKPVLAQTRRPRSREHKGSARAAGEGRMLSAGRRGGGGFIQAVGEPSGEPLRLVLAQEALEEAQVALLVVEDGDHHVVRHRIDLVGDLDDPAVVLDRAPLGLDHALDHVHDVDLLRGGLKVGLLGGELLRARHDPVELLDALGELLCMAQLLLDVLRQRFLDLLRPDAVGVDRVGDVAHHRLDLHPVRALKHLDDPLALGSVLLGHDVARLHRLPGPWVLLGFRSIRPLWPPILTATRPRRAHPFELRRPR